MNLNRTTMPAAVMAAALFMVAGCKSNTQQSENPAAQNSQTATSATTTAPAPGTAAGPAAAPSPVAPATPGAVAPAPQGPPPPAVINLPAGTELRVRLDDDLGSKISQTGEAFTATISDDVMVNGQTVIAKGARADGTVVDAQPLGHFKGGALLQVRLDRVHTNWGSYPVETASVSRVEKGKGKRTAVMTGGGGAFGALIGGLAGGGKGALIGGLAGAGAGGAGSALTGNQQIVLPAETLLTFKLEQSVRITEGR